MAVTVLFGKGGSGKTTRCFSQIQAWAESGRKALLLVPDQATYGMERRFAEFMPGKGFIGTQVVGFSRLAYRVFQERGKEHASLSELGRKIILQRLLRQHQDRCTVLQTAARQPHFVTTVGQFIGECRSFNIGPDTLRQAADQLGSQTLSHKLLDIALLYDGYVDFLQEHFGSADDVMTLLIQEIPKADFLKGAHVWVDGFQWFTPQQMEVLRVIEQTAAHLTITLTMDPAQLSRQVRETALFHRPYVVYQELRKYFPHVETETIHTAPVTGIHAFTDGFFQMVPQPCSETETNLTVTECSTRDIEIDAIARQIIKLCRHGYRYRDFLILARNSEGYSPVAERIFARYHIPLFSDYRRSMTSHPVTEAISALLDVFHSRWAYEPLFRLLKTDLFPLSRQEVDELENYCLAYGIQGYHWLNGDDWTFGRNRYLEETNGIDAAEEARLAHINTIRQAVIDVLKPFWEEAQTDHTLKEWGTFLYQWLVRLEVPATLRRWQEEDAKIGRALEEKEHEQVWKRILMFLDEMVRLCGDDIVTLTEFSRMVEDGLEELKFSLIPPTLDHVTLTSIERGYTMRAKIVFLCGLNDGIFPKHSAEEGLLNDEERQRLDKLGITLGPGSRFRSFQERFLFYLAATRAETQLNLSYVLADEDGGAMEASSWIHQIMDKAYVTTLQHETGDIPQGKEEEFIVAVPASLAYLPSAIQPATEGHVVDDVWWSLYDWAMMHGFHHQAVQAVQGLFYHNQPELLSPSLVRELYAPDGILRGSVTKFEQYRQCPFAYFAAYGLQLEERPLYQFAAPDLGMLVHGALKILGEDLLSQGKQWGNLDKNDIPALCRKATDQLTPHVQHDILMSNAYFTQIKERLIQTLIRTVNRLCQFSKASDFHMEQLEQSFGRTDSTWDALQFTLNNGLEVIVTGQIDRIDSMRKGDKKFVVIIDYKSGRTQLDLTQVFTGLELQLLTYMYVALCNMGDGAVPAAILYCYVRNDKTTLNHIVTEEDKKELYNKNSKLKGFYLDDGNVMQSLDTSMESYSEFMNMRLKKDGTLSNASHTMYDETGWQHLLTLASRRIHDIAVQMDSGDISIHPILLGQTAPCRFCPYHPVCRFDPQLCNNSYAVINKETPDDIIKKIYQEGDDGNGMD